MFCTGLYHVIYIYINIYKYILCSVLAYIMLYNIYIYIYIMFCTGLYHVLYWPTNDI